MTRAARRRKPFSSRRAMIFPALPDPNASGLMMASVRLPAMSLCSWVTSRSAAYQLPDDVPAREEADQPPLPHDRDPVDVLVAHHGGDLRERLLGGDAQHLPRHHVLHRLR